MNTVNERPSAELTAHRSFGEAYRFVLATILSGGLVLLLPFVLSEVVGLRPDLSVAIGMGIAFPVNFLTVKYFVFRSEAPIVSQFVAFTLSNGAIRLAEYSAFILLYHGLGIYYLLALVVVMTVAFVGKFLFHRRFIFGDRR